MSLAVVVPVVLALLVLHLPLEAGSQTLDNFCPAVNITSHKAYASFSPQNDDAQLWIVLCTDLRDTNIACNWDYFGDPITRPHNASSRTDQTPDGSCTNCSLVLYNVTYADSDGHYTVDAISSCGSRNSALFDLAVSGCPCGDNVPPPEAYPIPNVFIVESDTPLNFTLPSIITFRGCTNLNYFSSRVSLPTGPICSDSISYENFECVRQNMNCRFTESLTIINLTVSNSGNYCAQAVAVPSGGSDGNCTYFFLNIYPRPRITGPEILYNTQFRTSFDATLQWKVCKYSQALTIIASKNGANYTRVQIDNIVTEPDCRYVKVSGTAGTYKLLVMFNTSVNPLGFKPISSIPGVVTDSGIIGFILVVVILSLIVIIVMILGVCYLKRRNLQNCEYIRRKRKSDTSDSESETRPLDRVDGVHGDSVSQTSPNGASGSGSRLEIHSHEGTEPVEINAGRSPVQCSVAGNNCHVFLSYKHEPESIKCAEAVYKHLTRLSYRVYWDKNEIVGGDNISTQLTAAINKATIFLAILSSEYMTKGGELWCQRELDFAKLKNRKLLPVVIKGVNIPDRVKFTIGAMTMYIVYDPSNPRPGIDKIAKAVDRLLVEPGDASHDLREEHVTPRIDGTNGADGNSGFTEPEGPLDSTGTQGHQEEKGPHGAIGPAGDKGDKELHWDQAGQEPTETSRLIELDSEWSSGAALVPEGAYGSCQTSIQEAGKGPTETTLMGGGCSVRPSKLV